MLFCLSSKCILICTKKQDKNMKNIFFVVYLNLIKSRFTETVKYRFTLEADVLSEKNQKITLYNKVSFVNIN